MKVSTATDNVSVMSPAKTMFAARVSVLGGPEAIRLETIDVPEPASDEILVAVHAAGVGPWDGWIRSGNSVLPQPLPLTLGSDVSGVVISAGLDVSDFAEGQPVYGVTNKRFTDGYADYAVCKAAMMGRKPAAISHVEAASVPVIAATAWQMLFDHAKLSSGQSVLIHGAAGNVGRFAVQFARAAGLVVTATAGDTDRADMEALGAHFVVGRDLAVDGHLDAAIDLVGGESQERLFELVRPGGSLISSVSEPSAALAEKAQIEARFMLVDVNTAVLDEFSQRFDEGALKTFVGTVLPLSEAVSAHRMLEGDLPRQPGKIVLRVRE